MQRSHTPINTMLKLRNREGHLFSAIPKELIRHINNIYEALDSDFLAALSDAARGEFDALKAKLEAVVSDEVKLKHFLLQTGNVVTRSGLLVMGRTLLECAFEEFDTRMVAMIKPYFDKFQGGDQELESQLERCREAMRRPRNEKPYEALKRLINAIKNSLLKDIRAALLKKYEECNEELRNAFIEFRKETTLEVLANPGMHDDPALLLEAIKVLFLAEWSRLITKDESGQDSYDKHDLIWRQVIGWLMRNLVGVYRFAFARNDFEEDIELRTTNDKGAPVCAEDDGADFFPDNTSPSDLSLPALGFDYAILGRCGARWMKNAVNAEGTGYVGAGLCADFQILCQRTTSHLQELCAKPTLKPKV